jgi:hypothetical protein
VPKTIQRSPTKEKAMPALSCDPPEIAEQRAAFREIHVARVELLTSLGLTPPTSDPETSRRLALAAVHVDAAVAEFKSVAETVSNMDDAERRRCAARLLFGSPVA